MEIGFPIHLRPFPLICSLFKECKNIKIDYYYSSLQLRANNTLKIIQKVLNEKKDFAKAWQLNERHYGALTGLNKSEMV